MRHEPKSFSSRRGRRLISRKFEQSGPVALETMESRQLLAADLAANLSYTAGTYYPGQSIPGAVLNELNVGTDAADNFASTIVLSADATFGNADDIELARPERSGMPIAAGEMARTTKTLNISPAIPAGRYYVMVKVDVGDQITEATEANNIWTSATADVVVAKPVVTITATDKTASEAGVNTGRFRFTRTGPTGSPLVVRYTVGGTADATGGDADFGALSGLVTIGADQAFATVTITPVDDSRVEGVERVVLTLTADGAYATGAAASARVDINDNDGARVKIAATDAAAAETDTATATFTVSRAGSLAGDLVVNYTVGGTATSGSDFAPLTGSITIPGGEAAATITLTPIDDSAGEIAETVVLTISTAPWYLIVASRKTAKATITDNEAVVKIATTDASASEAGAGATGTATYTVTRAGSSAQALDVEYTVSGTATSGTDFVALSGTVTIPAGSLTATILLTPTDDALAEPLETVVLTLSSASGYRVDAGRRRATANIADNEPVISVVASDSAATENNTSTGTFTITRVGSQTADLDVKYTLSGTASNDGSDFVALTGMVTIPAGQASATVVITPVDDAVGEGSETVVLTLAIRSLYSRNPAKTVARITIADNEPSVSIVATDAAAGEVASGGTANPGVFRISRTGSTIGRLTVPYTIGGTAAAGGADYIALSGTVDILDGQAYTDISISPVDDGLAEPGETVILTIGPGSGYLLSNSRKVATVTIADNEPIVSIVATDASATEAGEGDAAAGTFTVSRAAASSSPLTVLISVAGTAKAGADFVDIPDSVTIPADATSVTITITPVQDLIGEGDESVEITLSDNSAYTVLTTGGKNKARLSIRDDEPVVSIAATDNTATENDQTDAVFTLTRTGSTEQLALPMTVIYRVEGSAETGDDFEPLDGAVTFAAGSATATITITAVDDDEGEPNENVVITLEAEEDSPYSVDSARAAASATIADNEPAISVTATTAAAAENNRPGVFTIRRTGTSADDLVVTYSVGGTATATTDYAALTGTATILAGQTSVTVTVTPVYDLLTEENETVKLTLTAGDGYKLDTAREATVTIANAQAVDLNILSVNYFGRSYSLNSTGVGSPIVINLNNLGLVSSGGFGVEFRLSTNTIWGDDDDVVIGSATSSAVAGGGASTIIFDFAFDSVKARLAEGNYYLACRIDSLSRVLESSEANNTFFSSAADIVVTA